MNKTGLKTALLWLWVVAITAAYIHQFRDLTGAVLNLLGFA